MDLFSLMAAFAAAFGIITTDAVMHSDTVNIHVALPSELARTLPKDEVLEEVYLSAMEEITSTRSFFGAPNLRSSQSHTIGSALARALKVEDFTRALQHQLGMKVATVNASFANDGGKLILMAVVADIDEPPFTLVLERGQDEPLKQLLQRAAEGTVEHLSPYLTAVYLLQQGDHDGADGKLDRLIGAMLRQYASSQHRRERATVLNLAGIKALHHHDLAAAEQQFTAADETDRELLIPRLNRAFVLLVLDRDQEALALLTDALPALVERRDRTLVAAAELIRAGACLALGQEEDAQRILANAQLWDPDSALVPGLMAELADRRGDPARARQLRQQAADHLDTFETYPELASLYYRLSWKKGEALVQNDLRSNTH